MAISWTINHSGSTTETRINSLTKDQQIISVLLGKIWSDRALYLRMPPKQVLPLFTDKPKISEERLSVNENKDSRINNRGCQISLAGPHLIKKWAQKQLDFDSRPIQDFRSNQILCAKTFDYKTFRPYPGGLFCEKLFGKLYDKSGSLARRHSLAYCQLAIPVMHIWYLKGTVCHLSRLLQIRRSLLQRLIYTQSTTVSSTDSLFQVNRYNSMHVIMRPGISLFNLQSRFKAKVHPYLAHYFSNHCWANVTDLSSSGTLHPRGSRWGKSPSQDPWGRGPYQTPANVLAGAEAPGAEAPGAEGALTYLQVPGPSIGAIASTDLGINSTNDMTTYHVYGFINVNTAWAQFYTRTQCLKFENKSFFMLSQKQSKHYGTYKHFLNVNQGGNLNRIVNRTSFQDVAKELYYPQCQKIKDINRSSTVNLYYNTIRQKATQAFRLRSTIYNRNMGHTIFQSIYGPIASSQFMQGPPYTKKTIVEPWSGHFLDLPEFGCQRHWLYQSQYELQLPLGRDSQESPTVLPIQLSNIQKLRNSILHINQPYTTFWNCELRQEFDLDLLFHDMAEVDLMQENKKQLKLSDEDLHKADKDCIRSKYWPHDFATFLLTDILNKDLFHSTQSISSRRIAKSNNRLMPFIQSRRIKKERQILHHHQGTTRSWTKVLGGVFFSGSVDMNQPPGSIVMFTGKQHRQYERRTPGAFAPGVKTPGVKTPEMKSLSTVWFTERQGWITQPRPASSTVWFPEKECWQGPYRWLSSLDGKSNPYNNIHFYSCVWFDNRQLFDGLQDRDLVPWERTQMRPKFSYHFSRIKYYGYGGRLVQFGRVNEVNVDATQKIIDIWRSFPTCVPKVCKEKYLRVFPFLRFRRFGGASAPGAFAPGAFAPANTLAGVKTPGVSQVLKRDHAVKKNQCTWRSFSNERNPINWLFFRTKPSQVVGVFTMHHKYRWRAYTSARPKASLSRFINETIYDKLTTVKVLTRTNQFSIALEPCGSEVKQDEMGKSLIRNSNQALNPSSRWGKDPNLLKIRWVKLSCLKMSHIDCQNLSNASELLMMVKKDLILFQKIDTVDWLPRNDTLDTVNQANLAKNVCQLSSYLLNFPFPIIMQFLTTANLLNFPFPFIKWFVKITIKRKLGAFLMKVGTDFVGDLVATKSILDIGDHPSTVTENPKSPGAHAGAKAPVKTPGAEGRTVLQDPVPCEYHGVFTWTVGSWLQKSMMLQVIKHHCKGLVLTHWSFDQMGGAFPQGSRPQGQRAPANVKRNAGAKTLTSKKQTKMTTLRVTTLEKIIWVFLYRFHGHLNFPLELWEPTHLNDPFDYWYKSGLQQEKLCGRWDTTLLWHYDGHSHPFVFQPCPISVLTNDYVGYCDSSIHIEPLTYKSVVFDNDLTGYSMISAMSIVCCIWTSDCHWGWSSASDRWFDPMISVPQRLSQADFYRHQKLMFLDQFKPFIERYPEFIRNKVGVWPQLTIFKNAKRLNAILNNLTKPCSISSTAYVGYLERTFSPRLSNTGPETIVLQCGRLKDPHYRHDSQRVHQVPEGPYKRYFNQLQQQVDYWNGRLKSTGPTMSELYMYDEQYQMPMWCETHSIDVIRSKIALMSQDDKFALYNFVDTLRDKQAYRNSDNWDEDGLTKRRAIRKRTANNLVGVKLAHKELKLFGQLIMEWVDEFVDGSLDKKGKIRGPNFVTGSYKSLLGNLAKKNAYRSWGLKKFLALQRTACFDPKDSLLDSSMSPYTILPRRIKRAKKANRGLKDFSSRNIKAKASRLVTGRFPRRLSRDSKCLEVGMNWHQNDYGSLKQKVIQKQTRLHHLPRIQSFEHKYLGKFLKSKFQSSVTAFAPHGTPIDKTILINAYHLTCCVLTNEFQKEKYKNKYPQWFDNPIDCPNPNVTKLPKFNPRSKGLVRLLKPIFTTLKEDYNKEYKRMQYTVKDSTSNYGIAGKTRKILFWWSNWIKVKGLAPFNTATSVDIARTTYMSAPKPQRELGQKPLGQRPLGQREKRTTDGPVPGNFFWEHGKKTNSAYFDNAKILRSKKNLVVRTLSYSLDQPVILESRSKIESSPSFSRGKDPKDLHSQRLDFKDGSFKDESFKDESFKDGSKGLNLVTLGLDKFAKGHFLFNYFLFAKSEISRVVSLGKRSYIFFTYLGLLKKTESRILKKRAVVCRQLRMIQHFSHGEVEPSWMFMTRCPILPPDLRPMIVEPHRQTISSDLNKLYAPLINENQEMHKLFKIKGDSYDWSPFDRGSVKSDRIQDNDWFNFDAADNAIRNLEEGSKQQNYKYPNITCRFDTFSDSIWAQATTHTKVQSAMDRLLQNGRGMRPALTGVTNPRPLKSLSDILKGKKGRFRNNLLGKRVDYSGRSVIVVGPKLRLHQCGLPWEMAIVLFEPFLIRELIKQGGLKFNKAKYLIKCRAPIVVDLLEQLLSCRPILLNRAPTLHRLGVQAFQGQLVRGRAILLHPLVCGAFNADFDGDQMAVHIPLGNLACAESWSLMWSQNHILSIATGDVVPIPSQDMVLGCYNLTTQDAASRSMWLIKHILGQPRPSVSWGQDPWGFCPSVSWGKEPGQPLIRAIRAHPWDGQTFANYSRIESICQIYGLSKHTIIWLKWKVFECQNAHQETFELTIDMYGHTVDYHPEYKTYTHRSISSDYIKTTMGKAIMNNRLNSILGENEYDLNSTT